MDFLGAAHDLTSLRSQQGPKNQSSASAVFGVSCIYCSYPVPPPNPGFQGQKTCLVRDALFKKMVRILVVTITGFGVDLSWMLMSVIVVRCLPKKSVGNMGGPKFEKQNANIYHSLHDVVFSLVPLLTFWHDYQLIVLGPQIFIRPSLDCLRWLGRVSESKTPAWH